MSQLTRRNFFELCGGIAALGAVGGAGKVLEGDALLLPPGAGDMTEFRSLCLKCDRCRSACPQGIIDTATIEDGLLNARLPLLNFHKGYCDFCGKCAQVCTVGALRHFSAESTIIGLAEVQTDRCIAHQGSGCVVCSESCPYDAIYVDSSGYPQVIADKCNGCGACEDACVALVYGFFSGGTRRGIVIQNVDRSVGRSEE